MKLFFDKIYKFSFSDFFVFCIILLFFGFLSTIRLGDRIAPNTFYRDNSGFVIIDLKKDTIVRQIKVFNGERHSDYNIFISNDGVNYDYLRNINSNSSFSWDMINVYAKGRFIKFEFCDDFSVGEIAILNNSNRIINNINIVDGRNNMINMLTDEYSNIPVKRSYMNSTYFDEAYFARTAYEYVYNLKTYEWTHPPLGKIIQAIPIYLTGYMSPFNYRFMGCIAGVLLIGIMYLFGTILFKKRIYGIVASFVMTFDTFRFAHSRMGTVDTYLVVFITLAFLFMILFHQQRKRRFLLLSGLFFGLSCCVKWTGLYSGFGLAFIYFYTIFKNRIFSYKYILYGFLFFVTIPFIIYYSTFRIFSNNYYRTDNLKSIIDENVLMYNYHSKLKATHFFSSKWYTWPISYKPVWYHYQKIDNNHSESISGVGNLVIWLGGIISFLYAIVLLIMKRDELSLLLVTIILTMWLPYVFVNRIMYLYHYFPVLPFLFLLIVNFLKDLSEKVKLKYLIPSYLLLCVIFFVLYFPVISGIQCNDTYKDKLKVFDTWYF